MYNKLEFLREIVENLEIEDKDKTRMLGIIEDLQREVEISTDAYSYLEDEDRYHPLTLAHSHKT